MIILPPGGQSTPTDPLQIGSPSFLAYFGVLPVIGVFVVATIEPFVGVTLVACLPVMIAVIKLLPRFCSTTPALDDLHTPAGEVVNGSSPRP